MKMLLPVIEMFNFEAKVVISRISFQMLLLKMTSQSNEIFKHDKPETCWSVVIFSVVGTFDK